MPKQELTLILKARDGNNIVYGSVLNPKENEVKAKLPKKILNALLNSRKKGNEETFITLTKLIKEKGSSNIYTLKPADSISIFGKLLVINVLASLTDVNGSIYTAGALPDGTYELTLMAGDVTTKGKFEYKTPVLVVGNVTTKGGKCVGGTQQVNSLEGKSISNVVALTSNCSYFNEVQANKINDKQKEKNRKHLYQSSDTTSTETTGLVLNLDASNLDNAGNFADSSDTATTWTDRSGSGNNGTLTNFTLPTGDTASGWDGANTVANPSVLKFDGTDDYVVLPSSVNSLVSGGTEITLAGWFKGTQINSIIRLQPGGGSNYIVLGWGNTNPNFIISTDGFTSGVNITNTSQDGNWHHVVGTWTKNTENGFKVYLDGVVVNQRNSANVNLPIFLSGDSYLGTYNKGSEFTNGSIANVRIYNIALTAEQIRQNYLAEVSKFQGSDTTDTEIPSSSPNTIDTTSTETTGLVLNLDASDLDNAGNSADSSDTATTWTDRSGSGNNGTLNSFTLPSDANSGWKGTNTPSDPSRLLFDGTGDNVTCGNASNLQLTTGTVEAWIKTSNAGTSLRGIVTKQNAYGFFLLDNVLVIHDWGASTSRSTDVNLADNNWHYVAFTFQSGIANGTNIYIDGANRLTTTITVSNQNTGVEVGRGGPPGGSGDTQLYGGSISRARIYSTALTAEQIRQNYSREVSKFQGSDTTTEEAKEIAISEAIATTSDGGIEELTAAIELDPENNGEKQFDINESTTQIVENAINFILGEEGVVSEEELEFTEEILQGEVKATLVEEETSEVEEAPEVEEGFIFEPTCNLKFTSILETVSKSPSNQELLNLGNNVIAQIESGELKNCFPKFITDIIERAKSREDIGVIAFAKKFIFHASETQIGIEEPDLEPICTELKKAIKLFESCKGGFCPPPPCIHPNIREELKNSCPEILALVPLSGCEEGKVACECVGQDKVACAAIGKPVNIIGAACIPFTSADFPNLCEPCNSDADCTNPKEVPETNCTLPINVCRLDILDYYGDPIGKGQHGAEGICYFDKKLIDPFTCEDLPFAPEPQILCLGPPPPAFCKLDPDGSIPSLEFEEGSFDRRCCKEMSTTLRTKTPLNTCVFERICSDPDTYFAPGEFGISKLDMFEKARNLCIIKTNSFDESKNIVACFNNPCPDSPLECLVHSQPN